MIGTDQNQREIMYSSGKNDECYTPAYAVKPILEFIPKNKIVWCPFDKENSEFVKQISQVNPVVFSHIDNGQDFFDYQPDKWDVMISNPPFQKKRKFFERAISFNKPFALIMTMTWMNEAAPVQLFESIGLQLLLFDKRIEFIQPNAKQRGKITFNSSYFCRDMLPSQIVMRRLNKKMPTSITPLDQL